MARSGSARRNVLASLAGLVLFLTAAHVYTSLTNYDRFVLVFGRSYFTDVARTAHVALIVLAWAWIGARVAWTSLGIVAGATTFGIALVISLLVSARTNQDLESVLQYDIGIHAWWIAISLSAVGAFMGWQLHERAESTRTGWKRLAVIGGVSLFTGVILYALRLHGPVGMLCKVALVLLVAPWSFLAAGLSEDWSRTHVQSPRWGLIMAACLLMSLFGFLPHG